MLYTVHICTYIWVTSTHVLKWWEFLQSSDFKFLPLLILKPFNSQHQSRHFQLQLLCISIFVLTLCPPNSQFGHFHLLHFVTLWRYEVRFQGQDQTALDKWLLLEVGWNAFLQPEERRLWKELCRPFRLDYDFLFFSLHVICVYFGSSFKGIERSIKESHLFPPRSKVGAFPDVYKNLVPWFSRLKARGSKVN